MTRAKTLSSNSTPASLLLRLKEPKNHIAWDRFVRLYTPLLLYWSRRAGLSESDAADVVQEVFFILVRKLPTFEYDPSKSFRAWLRTVLTNAWRNLRRKKTAEPFGTLDALPPATSDDLLELEEAEYRRHLVARAVALMQAEFQPKTWQACWELTVMGRSGDEVARDLGLSLNAVYLAKSRVLSRLRQELAGLLD
jgi:RNA polymerase sigma-70 factor, ECF subfamily